MYAIDRSNVTEITRAEWDRLVKHNYVGPLSTLHGAATRERYEELGADGWQVAWEEGRGTVLRPVKIVG